MRKNKKTLDMVDAKTSPDESLSVPSSVRGFSVSEDMFTVKKRTVVVVDCRIHSVDSLSGFTQ